MSLIVHEGKVGAVGTTDEAAVGYYFVKWLSEPYTLHDDTEGMSGMISTGKLVVDVLYFNPVHCTENWYTLSAYTTAVEVKHILRTGLQVQPISAANVLPRAYAREEAKQKKAVEVSSLDHEAIMEEASKCNKLEFNGNNDNDNDDDDDESNEESNEESEDNESKAESK